MGQELQRLAAAAGLALVRTADEASGAIVSMPSDAVTGELLGSLQKEFLGAKTYGAAFSVTVTNSGGTPTFRLVRPMAVTHHMDANQRQIVLTSTWNSASSTATVNAPNAKEAPSGYYMLFAVSPSGIPSKAVWIKL